MTDTPTIVSLPERSEARAVGDALRREIDAIIENVTTVARYRRAAYEAYLAVGFTVDQALTLCVK